MITTMSLPTLSRVCVFFRKKKASGAWSVCAGGLVPLHAVAVTLRLCRYRSGIMCILPLRWLNVTGSVLVSRLSTVSMSSFHIICPE